jgi:signal transduction histidine kinase
MHAVVAVPSLFVDHTLFAYSGSFPLAFSLYTVARHRDLDVSRWALLGSVVTDLCFAVHVTEIQDASDVIFDTIVTSLAFGTGVVLRRQARQRAELTAALEQLGREQEQRQRIAVLAERASLARELHDVVAHAVTLMLVQVGAARLAVDDDPEGARSTLLAVERTGREATGDLRRLLGLLREDTAPEQLHPAASLDGLRALGEQLAGAGLEVRLEVVGDPRALPPSLSLSAYRVVQEALTNVLKHAGPTRVLVRVDYADPLRIEVVDDGPRAPRPAASPSGHGLLGMQERVALFGGRVRTGRRDDGFAVSVELPLPRG